MSPTPIRHPRSLPTTPSSPNRAQPTAQASHVAHDLIALSRNTSRGLDHGTPNSSGASVELADPDYWYRLGQRNAYAQAAGLLLAPAVAEDAFTIAERITTQLDAGVTDVDELHSAAYGNETGRRPQALEWLGPHAFNARYGPSSLDELHCGMRWGDHADQRITLRPDDGGDRGLLFVYDPTWDEYALLATDVSVRAVHTALRDATQIDVHMDPLRFAALVTERAVEPEPVPSATPPVIEVQL